jgi:hypothetical protein
MESTRLDYFLHLNSNHQFVMRQKIGLDQGSLMSLVEVTKVELTVQDLFLASINKLASI